MIKKSKLLVFASLASLALLLAACGSGGGAEGGSPSSGDSKVLKMGTSADFPPFESRNEKGEEIGFDIDLAKHVAEELGYKLEISDMKFDGLIGALQTGRVDMVLSGMSATDERKKSVDFSTEYNRSGEFFVTEKDSDIQSIEDLNGKTVGVQLGTIQEDGAKRLKENEGLDFEVKSLDNSVMLIQELKTGRIDAAYMDKSVAVGHVKEQDLGGFDDPTTSSPGMAIAFPKGGDLVEDVNKVLAEMEKDGTLQELKDKWLSDQE
ncbi:ABC transporter substrate-binding protein [Bhargavaea ullalensis]|uniref:Polar amino acid transport system substrate-binding protein n=1 Tax=Bhargavaea ullalensis TaxID=1265685 RepID=A0ABV2G9P2_9BACL